MVESPAINLQHVARDLKLPLPRVQAAVELLDEGNTVPFITRYRKDQTGGLDEEQIRRIEDRLKTMRLLAERKQTILRSIEMQGKLTERLAKQIQSATTTKRLEDLYLPYKPKKQTLATLARSRGLEPLAHEILSASPTCADLDARAADFVNEDKDVATAADALLGAGHILAEQFSERADLRQRLRDVLHRTGILVSTQIAPAVQPSDKAPANEAPANEVSANKAPANEAPSGAKQEPAKASPADDSAESAPPSETPDDIPTDVAVESSAVEQEVTKQEVATSTGESMAVDPPVAQPVDAEAPAAEEASSDETSPPDADAEQPSEQPTAEEQPTTEGQPAPEKEPTAKEQPTQEQQPAADEPIAPAENAAAETPLPKAPSVASAKQRPTRAQTKKQQAHDKKLKAFTDYFDYRESAKKVPPHRVLAINRGERARILRVKIEADVKAAEKTTDELLIPTDHPHVDFLRGCARDSLFRLILPSLERELRREMTEKAEAHAVEVFARNLRNLLLQPPIRDSRVLAVDPGYRSGCKLVALDQFGNVLDHGVIYLVGKSQRKEKAKHTVVDLIDRYKLSVVVIGNGTACRETEDYFAELITGELKDRELAYVIVNEAGASVYSTSRLGREEFPEYDATVRGAVSIGRRLQDPLSELVKIEPARIGVGLYQHDVKAKHLHSSLDDVVESCVNYVGVNVNTASPALLRYVSGLNQLTARRLCEYRVQNGPFRNREQLKAVPGIGESTFVQAAGFLKIASGDQSLDRTWIHPESYDATMRVLAQLGFTTEDLTDKDKMAALSTKVAEIDLAAMSEQLQIGTLLLTDILAQLVRPGRDPREDLPKPVFKRGVLKLEDLSPGMELNGTVLNVVDFGAFVDIGMHDSGLVHISQLANQFVRDPHDIVAVGDIVKVWVVGIDKDRRRVSLTMIPPGSKPPERPPRRGRGKPADGKPGKERSGGDKSSSNRGARSSKSRKPHRKDTGRGKGKRFERATYRPKSRPKPVVPITKKMISGDAPMRTFGDLAQFYEIKKSEDGDDAKQDDSRKDKPKKKIEPDSSAQPKNSPEPEVKIQPAAEPEIQADPKPEVQTKPKPEIQAEPKPASEMNLGHEPPSKSEPTPLPEDAPPED